jgi:hypothetical protein
MQSSDDETIEMQSFDIHAKIIDKMSDNIFMIKISFRELLAYTQNWCYNRNIDTGKIDEIYTSLCKSYDMPFMLQAVFDEKYGHHVIKLLLLDGQHRKEAIRKYIEINDISMDCPYSVWVCVYKISNSESVNTDKVIDLFKKINNNRIFSTDELPDTFVVDLTKAVCDTPVFKKKGVIKISDTTKTAHSPCIHKKELHAIFNNHKTLIKNGNKTISDLVKNILLINHKISLMKYQDIYSVSHRQHETGKYEKAVALGFFLNLRNSQFTPEVWIKHINNPEGLSVPGTIVNV